MVTTILQESILLITHGLERGNNVVALLQNIGKSNNATATKPSPRPICTMPEWVVERDASKKISNE